MGAEVIPKALFVVDKSVQESMQRGCEENSGFFVKLSVPYCFALTGVNNSARQAQIFVVTLIINVQGVGYPTPCDILLGQ